MLTAKTLERRGQETRVHDATHYKEERDRWIEVARMAMENARRVAKAWQEFLELNPEDETP